MAIFSGDDWHVRADAAMHRAVRTGKDAIDLIYGVAPFEYLSDHPEEGLNFNRAMTSFSTTEVPAIVEAYDFAQFGSLVEVAGGHGLFLSAIFASAPDLKATLLELPQVIAEMAETPLDPYRDRAAIMPGDMFVSVPAEADA
ncbi:hypothetical protein GRI89_10675 [Altererythrobacter salegens]|uniref:O-methyltransferase C-terminal domain-containing protein n=1 Tax=Croceibacterium salegens TaxID=1737568 RepID=A0A6I4T064_9SPHN|nr:hypothetical protein [Croceibacterium salegens]